MEIALMQQPSHICILPCLDYHSGSLPISLDEDQKTERVNVSMNPEAQNDNHTFIPI